jgi:hypothetical protein
VTTPDLTGISVANADEARARIAKLESACGCGLGAAVAGGALVVYLVLLSIGLDGSTPAEIGGGVAAFVAGAAAGKALGRLRALRERQRLLVHLAAAAERTRRDARSPG